MIIQIITFIVGLLILLPCTRFLVKLSELLANNLKISPLVAGITLVAFGTSLPELVVSVTASLNNDYGLALGNIIGSNISNILLVFATALVIGKLRIGTTKTQKRVLVLIMVSLMYLLLHLANFLSSITGVFLIFVGVVFTCMEYKWGVDGGTKEDKKRINNIVDGKYKFKIIHLIFLLLSLAGIIGGGLLIVQSTENLAKLTGYSTTILGLSLTAIATSLPELLTTIFSIRDKEEKLTLGNILGSNIYNLTFIGGISALFSYTTYLLVSEWLWFLLSAFVLLIIVKVYKDRSVPKVVGVSLLLLFALYLVTLNSIH